MEEMESCSFCGGKSFFKHRNALQCETCGNNSKKTISSAIISKEPKPKCNSNNGPPNAITKNTENYSKTMESDIRKRIQQISERNKQENQNNHHKEIIKGNNENDGEKDGEKDENCKKAQKSVPRYSEETFSYFRKTIVLKIENTILLDREIEQEIFEDFLFLLNSPCEENQKSFLNLLQILIENTSKFTDYFFEEMDKKVFEKIVNCFERFKPSSNFFLSLLRKIKEIDVNILNENRNKIEETLPLLLKKIDPKPQEEKVIVKEETKQIQNENSQRIDKIQNDFKDSLNDTPKTDFNYEKDGKNEKSKSVYKTPTKSIKKVSKYEELKADSNSNALFEISKKLTETHCQLEEINRKYITQKNKNKQLKIQLNQSETDRKLLNGMKRELGKKLSGMENKYKTEISERKRTREEATLETSNLVAKVELLETENSRLRERERILQSQNSNETRIRLDLENDHETLKKRSDSMKNELESFRKKSNHLNRSFEALKRMATSQLFQAGELYKKQFFDLRQTRKDLGETESKQSGISLRLKDCQADLKAQKSLKEQFHQRIEELENENTTSKNQNEKMMESLLEAKRKIEELEAEILSITQIKQQFMNQLLEKQEMISRLQSNDKTQNESVEELKELKKHLDCTVRENHELKSRLFDESEGHRKTREENKELLAYLDQLLRQRGE